MKKRAKLVPCVIGVAAMAAFGLTPPAHATYPARNGLILFAADTGTGYQLFTVTAGCADLHQITQVDGDALSPDWSPDGSKIVFELDTRNVCLIELMNADGTDMVNLTRQPRVCEDQPSFTPDGDQIVFERDDPATHVDGIWEMDLSGRHRHLITPGSGNGVTDPNVSPDGTTLSFIDHNGKDVGQGVYTTTMDGSDFTEVLAYKKDVAIKQDWAPDGANIVATIHADLADKRANVVTVHPDGTDLQLVTHYRSLVRRAYVGSYSPNGCWIVFRLEEPGGYTLDRVHPDGTDLRVILPLSNFRPRFIDWGPDSQE
jgi:Tol biopolymer transport system component